MKIIICSILFFASLFSQSSNKELALTGNLFNDSRVIQNNYKTSSVIKYDFQQERKSPLTGGIMSLIIPGAGEYYAEQYWKAGIFLTVEVAAITTAIIFNNKGDNKTDEFESFANKNWDVKRYAEWTLANLERLNPSLIAGDYHVINENGSVNWTELNRLEHAIGDGYSHALAPFGDQQYYEMIGKYPQFSHGWNDSNPNDTDYHILSPNFHSYSFMRGDANDLYSVASTAVVFIYINHVLSALDAAWSVAHYNSELAMKMRVEQINYAGRTEFVPTISFALSF